MNEATTISGLPELMKAFVKLGTEAMPLIADASTEGAKVVLSRAKGKVKHITGDLEKGLKVSKPNKRSKSTFKLYARVMFGSKAAHGVNVELGHKLVMFGNKTDKRVPEHPFLRPAADESKDEVLNHIIDAMNKALDGMGGKK